MNEKYLDYKKFDSSRKEKIDHYVKKEWNSMYLMFFKYLVIIGVISIIQILIQGNFNDFQESTKILLKIFPIVLYSFGLLHLGNEVYNTLSIKKRLFNDFKNYDEIIINECNINSLDVKTFSNSTFVLGTGNQYFEEFYVYYEKEDKGYFRQKIKVRNTYIRTYNNKKLSPKLFEILNIDGKKYDVFYLPKNYSIKKLDFID